MVVSSLLPSFIRDGASNRLTMSIMPNNIGEFVKNEYIGFIVPSTYTDSSSGEVIPYTPVNVGIEITTSSKTYSASSKGYSVGYNLLGIDEPSISNIRLYVQLSAPAPNIDIPEFNQAASILISDMYFLVSSLSLYITPQQLRQFQLMYTDCVPQAYKTACGKLTANIGNRFDMAAVLNELDESKKDDTIRWILQVLTAYNICAPSLNISDPLEDAYREVSEVVQKLKGGQVSLEEPAPYRDDQYSANAEVITSRYKYLG